MLTQINDAQQRTFAEQASALPKEVQNEIFQHLDLQAYVHVTSFNRDLAQYASNGRIWNQALQHQQWPEPQTPQETVRQLYGRRMAQIQRSSQTGAFSAKPLGVGSTKSEASAMLPDGQVAVGFNHHVGLFDKEGASLGMMTTGQSRNTALWFQPNTHSLVVGMRYDAVKIFDVPTQQRVQSLSQLEDTSTMAPLGQHLLATGCTARERIHVTDLRADEVVATFEEHTAGVQSVRALPNGQLVSCSADQTIKVWDTRRQGALQSLTTHGHLVAEPTTEYLPRGLCVLDQARVACTSLAIGTTPPTVSIYDLSQPTRAARRLPVTSQLPSLRVRAAPNSEDLLLIEHRRDGWNVFNIDSGAPAVGGRTVCGGDQASLIDLSVAP